MPALKYWDAASGTYKELFSGQKGEKGDKGDPGEPGADGAPGDAGSLDALSDVAAPASTPVGKVLGTTGTGVWGPIDPPPTGLDTTAGDARYVNVTGDAMSGGLTVTGLVKGTTLESTSTLKVAGKVMGVSAPTANTDGANKKYVDDRIWKGTQAQYDAIVTKDPAILYVIVA